MNNSQLESRLKNHVSMYLFLNLVFLVFGYLPACLALIGLDKNSFYSFLNTSLVCLAITIALRNGAWSDPQLKKALQDYYEKTSKSIKIKVFYIRLHIPLPSLFTPQGNLLDLIAAFAFIFLATTNFYGVQPLPNSLLDRFLQIF